LAVGSGLWGLDFFFLTLGLRGFDSKSIVIFCQASEIASRMERLENSQWLFLENMPVGARTTNLNLPGASRLIH